MDTESNLIEDSRDVESVLEHRTEEPEEYESSSGVEKEEEVVEMTRKMVGLMKVLRSQA